MKFNVNNGEFSFSFLMTLFNLNHVGELLETLAKQEELIFIDVNKSCRRHVERVVEQRLLRSDQVYGDVRWIEKNCCISIL